MHEVTIDKAKLLKKLKKNRKQHRQTFLKAQKGYRREVIKLLDSRLQRAREGGKIDMVFRLPEPRDYTESYDTAIQMVEWSVDETITISQTDFERFVLDQWDWKGAFEVGTMAYVGG